MVVIFLKYMEYHKIQIQMIILLFFKMDILTDIVKDVINNTQLWNPNGVNYVIPVEPAN